ncbi:MAG: D-cysteine desulfhydrase family protein [Rhodocyclaceae bacterium]|nr:D-cysteine desulfhydrase family protein [Rhodocyclaceae bacterium]MBX3669914.1 D-cysteine desulfhydrase family protein [Rhodocyclaceae bacterium]
MPQADFRIALAQLPTPLEPAPRLGRALGAHKLYIKRDDQTGLGLGGNKLRKLEFLLGDARARGADTILTVGAMQSNHARQTAAACARLGLQCELVLRYGARPAAAYLESGNVILNRLFGARITQIAAPASREEVMQERAERLRAEGRKPYLIPVGGSCLVGNFGYVMCAEEMLQQFAALPHPVRAVVVANGSGGTQAGLVAGMHLLNARIKVIGIAVEGSRREQEEQVFALAAETVAALGGRRLPRAAVTVLDEWAGPGYAKPTPQMLEAVALAAAHEGLVLDPVYTGKAMSGLVGLFREGYFGAEDGVVFLHSGGAPGLFAYPDLFARYGLVPESASEQPMQLSLELDFPVRPVAVPCVDEIAPVDEQTAETADSAKIPMSADMAGQDLPLLIEPQAGQDLFTDGLAMQQEPTVAAESPASGADADSCCVDMEIASCADVAQAEPCENATSESSADECVAGAEAAPAAAPKRNSRARHRRRPGRSPRAKAPQ